MKKSLFILLFITFFFNAYAQFSSDNVRIYVKAGDNPAYSNRVMVIAYYASANEIRNMCSSSEQVRKTKSIHPEYFNSPGAIPQTTNCLSTSFRIAKRCQYNSSASNSKYTVYSGTRKGGTDMWGYSAPATINFAFSKDGRQLVVWESGKEDQRVTYLLTSINDFEPSTSSSSNYDFLE